MRMSSLGDVVLTEPVVAKLRTALPGAEIGFLVKRRFVDLVESNPDLTRVHTLDDSSFSTLIDLRRELIDVGYDTVIDLHRYPRSVLLARSLGARRVATYRKREFGAAFAVRVLKRPFHDTRLRVQRYIDTLAALGVDTDYRRPRLHVARAHLEWTDDYLESNGLAPGRYACISPGAAWPLKRWPESRFAELARVLADRLGLGVVLTGSAPERKLCETVRDLSGLAAPVTAGETTLGRLCALISRSALFVGNDSGPAHVAVASGTPTVAIFGPIDPRQFDFEGHALVYAGAPCSACCFFGPRRCRRRDWQCMLSISVDEVARAASRLVSQRQGVT
jgi:ADP-heptose:LPS heptosyltransferase